MIKEARTKLTRTIKEEELAKKQSELERRLLELESKLKD